MALEMIFPGDKWNRCMDQNIFPGDLAVVVVRVRIGASWIP